MDESLRSHCAVRLTVVECCVAPDIPVIVTVYIVDFGTPLPPPQAVCIMIPTKRIAPIGSMRTRLLLEMLTPNPVPRKAKPATGNHTKPPSPTD
jgi:hypothetical protein